MLCVASTTTNAAHAKAARNTKRLSVAERAMVPTSSDKGERAGKRNRAVAAKKHFRYKRAMGCSSYCFDGCEQIIDFCDAAERLTDAATSPDGTASGSDVHMLGR